MSFNQKQLDIVKDFKLFDDWMEKYEFIIDLGKDLDRIPEDEKKEEQLIHGCQSRVWLMSEFKDQKMYFYADSDAIITKGIIALLIRAMNGEAPETIVKEELFFITEIGIQEHLSPTRANGLLMMVKRMKLESLKHI